METTVAAPPYAALSLRRVSKSFVIPHRDGTSLKQRLVDPTAARSNESFHALRDVTFDVRRGEVFGIVGRNGSGKSTLLRCMAGIYPVDDGDVVVRGRLASFIDLSFGFHPELAARDNAVLSAVMFGLSRREAERRFDAMLAFAELEQFVDQKLKHYSSGMALRLAFAVAVHVDADVLLFDEVLAVGDASFRSKCLGRLDELRADGSTIVLVTHDMELVRGICSRALLLHRGEVIEQGTADDIARGYEHLNDENTPFPLAVTQPTRPARPRRRALAGPSESQRLAAIVRTLATTDFKLKYAGTALNYLWAVARPLALFGVLLLVFTNLGHFDAGVDHYPAYVLMGVMLWMFFVQATTVAVTSLVDRAPFLRTLPLPRVAVPLAVVAGALLDLCINLVLVFALILALGITPDPRWLELPLLILLLTALSTGASLLLAALYVRFRDVDQVWLVVSQTIFYLSPVFYVVGALPGSFDRILVLANPLATILTEARHAVIDPAAPSAAAVAGGAEFLVVPVAICAGALALGAWVFNRESPRAAESV